MKKIILVLVVSIFTFTVQSQDAEGVTITLIVENVLNDNGYILAGLHSKDTFMKSEGLQNVKEKAHVGEMSITFKNVKPGTFAIMVLHDANDNNRMDFEANGMPKENYGMSQNPMLMGPPSFTDAQFEVMKEDMELHIRF